MRIYWLNEFEKGDLGMMARPKGNDWLKDEIITLKELGICSIVSLLESNEEIELEIEKEKELCEHLNIDFICFPIRDRKVPKDDDSFIQLISRINHKLYHGEKIVVHCRMGIRRTSMVAAGVLIKNGIDANAVFNLLSKIRTLSVPDTREQKQWVIDRTNRLQKRLR